MNLTDLQSALTSRNYLALFVLLALYARKVTSADSVFPVTIPAQWKPAISAGVGLVYGGLAARQAGSSWGDVALMSAVSAGASGFADALLVAIFNHGAAPKWARAIVFVFDDLTRNSGKPVASAKPTVVPAAPPPPPVVTRRRLGRPIAALALAVVATLALAGCSLFQNPATSTNPVAAVQADVQYVQTFEDGAKGIWATIAPLLGSMQGTATTYFNAAITALNGALVSLEDLASTYVAGTQPNPDWSTAIAGIQAAVAQVVSVIDQFRGSGDAGALVGAAGPSTDTLHHQAGVIAAWRAP